MFFTIPTAEYARSKCAHLDKTQSWAISRISTGPSFLRIEKLGNETLVVLCLTTIPSQVLRRRRTTALTSSPTSVLPISESEFDELASLRQAQGWGTPIFRPGHPKFERTMARLAELEARECATGLFESQHLVSDPKCANNASFQGTTESTS